MSTQPSTDTVTEEQLIGVFLSGVVSGAATLTSRVRPDLGDDVVTRLAYEQAHNVGLAVARDPILREEVLICIRRSLANEDEYHVWIKP